MISYNIDDYGNLRLYRDNMIVCEVSGCSGLTEIEIQDLIDELLEERSVFNVL